jgi:hypothetical protein
MRALAVIFAFLVAAAPAYAQGPPAGWKPWRYPELHVAFSAPPDAKPTTAHSVADLTGAPGAKRIDDQIVVFGTEHLALMLGVSDMSGNSLPLDINGVAPAAAKGMGATISGSVRTLPWSGGEAREYDAAKPGLVARSRIILVGRRLFQAMVVTDSAALPSYADAFLASMQPLP